jgi:hypothetical protein
MRGDLVIVRAYGGVPFVRRIWDEDDQVIFITNDEQLKLLLAGETAIQPIGFPREDVFKYDPELATSIEQFHRCGKWDWKKLVPF